MIETFDLRYLTINIFKFRIKTLSVLIQSSGLTPIFFHIYTYQYQKYLRQTICLYEKHLILIIGHLYKPEDIIVKTYSHFQNIVIFDLNWNSITNVNI